MDFSQTEERFDPYKILDIQPDADDAAIRRAFRKKVRSCHPDSGGTAEAFRDLKHAYDLLSDPEKRRHFDETGEINDRPLDLHQAKIIEILSIGLDKALFKIATEPQEFSYAGLLDLIRAEIEEKRKELRSQKLNFEHALQISQDLADRFLVSDGKNLMKNAISQRIRICENQIEHIAEEISKIDESLIFLDKLHYQMPLNISYETSPKSDKKKPYKGYHPLLDWGDLIKF